jgi:rfaE bifunctional protein kinase chain/domain
MRTWIDWSTVVVISDYGHLPEFIIRGAIEWAERRGGKYIIVDPKRPGRIYQGADLLTPNEKEWEALQHSTYGATALVTLGERGMQIVDPKSDKVIEIPSDAQEVFDVTGAGDTVVAVMAAAMGSGYTVEAAARLANRAAAIACRHFGTYAPSVKELWTG